MRRRAAQSLSSPGEDLDVNLTDLNVTPRSAAHPHPAANPRPAAHTHPAANTHSAAHPRPAAQPHLRDAKESKTPTTSTITDSNNTPIDTTSPTTTTTTSTPTTITPTTLHNPHPTMTRPEIVRLIASCKVGDRVKVEWRSSGSKAEELLDGCWYGEVVVARIGQRTPAQVKCVRKMKDDGEIVELSPATVLTIPQPGISINTLRVLRNLPPITHPTIDDIVTTTPTPGLSALKQPPPPYVLPVVKPADSTTNQPTITRSALQDPKTFTPPPEPEISFQDACADDDGDSESEDDGKPRKDVTFTTTTCPPPPHFRASDGSAPTVADLTGADVNNLVLAQKRPDHIPVIAWQAIIPATRALHHTWLLHLQHCPPHLPLTLSILEMIRQRGLKKTWEWSTILKYLLTIEAALKALPMYTTEDRAPILLWTCPIWKAAVKTAKYRGNTTPTREPLPATATEIERVYALEPNPLLALFIKLSWLTAARLGDTASLRRQNVVNSPSVTSITYMEAKGSHFRGPYTVHVGLPKDTQQQLQDHLLTLGPREKIFPITFLRAALISIRRANPLLEAKSLRRGALQTMSRAGVKEETLREFSGHTNNTTLRRYLSWGRTTGVTSKTTVLAGKILQGPNNASLSPTAVLAVRVSGTERKPPKPGTSPSDLEPVPTRSRSTLKR